MQNTCRNYWKSLGPWATRTGSKPAAPPASTEGESSSEFSSSPFLLALDIWAGCSGDGSIPAQGHGLLPGTVYNSPPMPGRRPRGRSSMSREGRRVVSLRYLAVSVGPLMNPAGVQCSCIERSRHGKPLPWP
jgi:hypothetical protein